MVVFEGAAPVGSRKSALLTSSRPTRGGKATATPSSASFTRDDDDDGDVESGEVG